jgi:two-component system sensor kinase FixL
MMIPAAGASLRGIRVEMNLDPAVSQVLVDRVQIQQVLLNLVRNAIEALGDLPPARRHIVIGTLATGEREVEAYVRDLGPGITAGDAARMFDPFFTTKETGTGLGLAISRTIARAHQGQLGYRPNSPFGAEFFLRLPTLEP